MRTKAICLGLLLALASAHAYAQKDAARRVPVEDSPAILDPTIPGPGTAAPTCPGLDGCVPNVGCPTGSIRISPGQSIQRAIAAAPCTGAVLCVAPGTYNEKIDFLGKPIHLVASGPGAILDGGGTGTVVTFQTGEGKNSILDGFQIQNGQANYGAGILIKDASPTIRNCKLVKNQATGSYARGGGIGVTGAQSRPAITCTQFLGNTAAYAGGGLISTYSADPYLRSNLFEGNRADYGGGIGVHINGRLDLGTSLLIGNQAIDGAGIHVGTTYGNVLVRRTWLKGNRATAHGGGMWVAAGFADVINSNFDGNSAADGGGLAAGYGSMVNVANTLFVRNQNANSSAALINSSGSNTSVVNHYNAFFGNTGGPNYKGTYGDKGLVLLPGFGNSCCPSPGSPAINAGIPDYHFNDLDGSRSDIGPCGGPAI